MYTKKKKNHLVEKILLNYNGIIYDRGAWLMTRLGYNFWR